MKYLATIFLLFAFINIKAQNGEPSALSVTIDSLNDVAKSLLDAFQFEDALQTVTKAKQLEAPIIGQPNPPYITSCNIEVSIYWRMGDYDRALQLCEAALMLQEELAGRENVEYAGLVHLRGTLHLEMANYPQGEIDFQESLRLRGELMGKNNAKYAMTLNNLGNLYGQIGDTKKAFSAHHEAMEIRKAVMGEDSFDYGMSLSNLSRICQLTGEFEKSIEYVLQAIKIVEKIKGKDHPILAHFTLNLAGAYVQTGQYKKAESTFEECLKLTEKAYGPSHPQYAFVLNDLGLLYNEMGLTELSKSYYVRSIEIKEKTIGRDHNYTLISLGNLAKAYQEEGLLDEAEAIYLEIIEVYRNNYGANHREALISQNNLANIYLEKGMNEKADSMHRAILENWNTTKGQDHPGSALSFTGIAKCHKNKGELRQALTAYKEAQRILSKSYGDKNLYTIATHNFIAGVYQEMGEYENALKEAEKFSVSLGKHLLNSSKHLSSNELLFKLPAHRESLDFVQGLRLKCGYVLPSQIGVAYNDALFYKGMILENGIRLEREMAVANDSLREVYLEWKALQRRLGESYSQTADDQVVTKELEIEAEKLEKQLLKNLTFKNASEVTHWQEVQDKLLPREAAIEFVHFTVKEDKADSRVAYAALLLKNKSENPLFLPLFDEKSLDSLVEIQNTRKSDYVNVLYAFDQENNVDFEKPKRSLFEMIWQPLEEHLTGIDKIYYSPSGLLHRLNLGAIPTEEGTTLSDHYNLVQLGSTRQLVFKNELENSNNSALLFGGIQYDADTTAMLTANAALAIDEIASRSRGDLDFNETDSTLRGGKWRYLNGTDIEVAVIQQIMKHASMPAEIKKGYAATEEAFKNISQNSPSPRVLHLATHGYFFPDPKQRTDSPSGTGGEVAFKMSEHPMIRSGLILAGGNHIWQEGKPIKEGMEDGILTAYEISQMNLSNTELVVLSACETGLGDIQGNEGVYGLQRAFKIAGAKYLIMSLWQVPDYQTHELMTAFYENWLEGQMSIPDAFRTAQQRLREQYSSDPFFWAGFVLVE
jgi:CHAT domain-containing protein